MQILNHQHFLSRNIAPIFLIPGIISIFEIALDFPEHSDKEYASGKCQGNPVEWWESRSWCCSWALQSLSQSAWALEAYLWVRRSSLWAYIAYFHPLLALYPATFRQSYRGFHLAEEVCHHTNWTHWSQFLSCVPLGFPRRPAIIQSIKATHWSFLTNSHPRFSSSQPSALWKTITGIQLEVKS